MSDQTGTQLIHGYCALCIARCGTVATVEGGRFTRLDPDPSHPTGQAICAKGRAAPELVYGLRAGQGERSVGPDGRVAVHYLPGERPRGEAHGTWGPVEPTCGGRGHRTRTTYPVPRRAMSQDAGYLYILRTDAVRTPATAAYRVTFSPEGNRDVYLHCEDGLRRHL
jgi:hypothetical protein